MRGKALTLDNTMLHGRGAQNFSEGPKLVFYQITYTRLQMPTRRRNKTNARNPAIAWHEWPQKG